MATIGTHCIRAKLEGHTQAITDLDWSADGKLLATCSRDQTVRVWDARGPITGASPGDWGLWTGSHEDEAMSVRFSPDGAMVASAGRDCRVRCWRTRDGAPVATFFGPAPFRTVTWSPDSQHVCVAQTNAIHLYSTTREDAAPEDYLRGHSKFVRRVLWLPDGTILSGGEDGQLMLWSGPPRHAIKTHHLAADGGITDLAISNRNGLLAAACRDGIVRLWSVKPLKPIGELRASTLPIRRVVFFLDGRFVAATDTVGRVSLHDTTTRALHCEFEPSPEINLAAPHPARPIMALATGNSVMLVHIDASPQVTVPVPPPPAPARSQPVPEPGSIRILFLAANPTDQARLRVGHESTAIKESLDAAKLRVFDVVEHHALRLDSIQKAILRNKPTVVHFSGHGSDAGSLIFEDLAGNSAVADPEALGELFRLAGDRTKLIVLNACYSREQADILIDHVDAVIGMATAIPDVTAIAFSKSLYENLGEGCDIKLAFELAKNYIRFNNLPGSDIPELRLRGGRPTATVTTPA